MNPRGCLLPSALPSVLFVVSLLSTQGCHSDRLIVPRDTTAPHLQVLSPVDTTYDLDGDKLVDLQLSWSDSGGSVRLETVRVRSLDGLNGPADASTNLLLAWRVARLDSTGLVLHETLENLLHGGVNRLEVAVADTAGNRTVDTISFTLPHGALFKTLASGVRTAGHGIGATVCPDDRRAYVTVGRSLVVIDADSLRVLATVADPAASDDLYTPLCVPGDPVLYVTERVERFDRPSMQWLPRVTRSFGATGIAQSRADPNILYVGESYTGGVALIDRAQSARIGSIPLPGQGSPENPEYVFDVAVLPGDSKIYFTRYLDGGVLVADPRTGTILKHIGVGGATWPDSGSTDAFVLSNDNRSLYVAVLDGAPRGVAEINTQTDAVVRFLPLANYVPQEIALSPSGRRLFVTTQDRWLGQPSQNVLIDVDAWRVLAEFPRPRAEGATRWDGGVAFHPNGKLVFVGRDRMIDVYLSRE